MYEFLFHKKAIELRKKGFNVTVFEALPKLGGILSWGIPGYRLNKKNVDKVASRTTKTKAGFRAQFTSLKKITGKIKDQPTKEQIRKRIEFY